MLNQSITLNYVLWVSAQRGAVNSPWHAETKRCLVAGALWELARGGILRSDARGRYRAGEPLPEGEHYFAPLYDALRAATPKKLTSHLTRLTEGPETADALVASCTAHLLDQGSLRNSRSRVVTTDSAEAELISAVTEAVLSEDGPGPDMWETVLIIHAANLLKRGFKEYQWTEVKKKLSAFRETGEPAELWSLARE